jgi:hypothetical protein
MLAPHFPFDAQESPLSYAARLAMLHTEDPVVSLLRDFEIRPEKMAINDETALRRLAEVAGVSVGDLRQRGCPRWNTDL